MHEIPQLLQRILSATHGNTDVYDAARELAKYAQRLEKDATAWRNLMKLAESENGYVIGEVAGVSRQSVCALGPWAVPEFQSGWAGQKYIVRQATFRWVVGRGQETMIEALQRTPTTKEGL